MRQSGGQLGDRVQSAVDELVGSGTETGLQVCVLKDGDVVADATAGIADINSGGLVRPDTLFRAGSVAKGVTASLVHVLVEREILDYELQLGSTGDTEQKSINLHDNSHVVLSTGGDAWDHGLSIALEGDATRVTNIDYLARLAKAWEGKWDGCWHYDVGNSAFQHGAGEAIVYVVAPTKVLTFGLGAFSHTRYQFS